MSLVTKHPRCQWCCAGPAAGTREAEKPFKQGQPGRAARYTALFPAPCSLLPAPCSLLPAPARAPNTRTQHWLQHQQFPEVTNGTIQEATSSWHQQGKQVWICRNLFPGLCFNSDHAFLVGEAVTFVWLQLFIFEVTKPCLASLLRDFAFAKDLVQLEERVLASRDNTPKLLH